MQREDNYETISERLEYFLEEIFKPRFSLAERMKALSFIKNVSTWYPYPVSGVPECQEVVYTKQEVSKFASVKSAAVTVYDSEHNEQVTEVLPVSFASADSDAGELRWPDYSRISEIFRKTKENDFLLALSCCSGALDFALSFPLPESVSPWLFAGLLCGEGIGMAGCISNTLSVPADSDLVIEGHIDRSEFSRSGSRFPLFHITAITSKTDASIPLEPEGEALVKRNRGYEKLMLPLLKKFAVPELEDIAFADGGVCSQVLVLKIAKRYEGEAIKVAHAIWGSQLGIKNKAVIIVDGNFEIRDREKLSGCILENYIPRGNTSFTRGPGCGKICIDATAKLNPEHCSRSMESGKKRVMTFVNEGDPLPKDSLVVIEVKDKGNAALAQAVAGCDMIAHSRFIGEGEDSSLFISSL